MHYGRVVGVGVLALGLAAGACNRHPAESRDQTAPAVDHRADLQHERDQQISELDNRVAHIEHEYAEANEKADKATAGLRQELQ